MEWHKRAALLASLAPNFAWAQALPNTCCRNLQAALGTSVTLPATAQYQSYLKSYWSLQEQSVTPVCVVSPRKEQDLSTAIRILASGRCEFAIRGGGHNPFRGSANSDGGATVDLSQFNTVSVNPENTIVSVGGGARWRDVYKYLDALELSTSGGRVGDVGVGGLTTGGGMSYFAPRYGFVADNVVSFRVVLASGFIVSANATSNMDLWWALKGGSNNFGIVVNFDLKTFPQGQLWGGLVVNPISSLPQQLSAFTNLNKAQGYDGYASFIQSYGYVPASNAWAVGNYFMYTKPEANPDVYKPFTAIQPQLTPNDLRIANLSEFTAEQDVFIPAGHRYAFATSTYASNTVLLNTLFNIANSTLQPLLSPVVDGLQWTLIYQPLPPAITTKAQTNGGSPLPFSANEEPQVLTLITAIWSDAADDARMRLAMQQFFHQADQAAAKVQEGKGSWVYLNYAAEWQDPIGSYGAANVGRLMSVSRRYDPTGVFQELVKGGFKIAARRGGYGDGPDTLVNAGGNSSRITTF